VINYLSTGTTLRLMRSYTEYNNYVVVVEWLVSLLRIKVVPDSKLYPEALLRVIMVVHGPFMIMLE
jgi:hypothetical protein